MFSFIQTTKKTQQVPSNLICSETFDPDSAQSMASKLYTLKIAIHYVIFPLPIEMLFIFVESHSYSSYPITDHTINLMSAFSKVFMPFSPISCIHSVFTKICQTTALFFYQSAVRHLILLVSCNKSPRRYSLVIAGDL